MMELNVTGFSTGSDGCVRIRGTDERILLIATNDIRQRRLAPGIPNVAVDDEDWPDFRAHPLVRQLVLGRVASLDFHICQLPTTWRTASVLSAIRADHHDGYLLRIRESALRVCADLGHGVAAVMRYVTQNHSGCQWESPTGRVEWR